MLFLQLVFGVSPIVVDLQPMDTQIFDVLIDGKMHHLKGSERLVVQSMVRAFVSSSAWSSVSSRSEMGPTLLLLVLLG
jgi:hypothetical protein